MSFQQPIDNSPFLAPPPKVTAARTPKSRKLTKKERVSLETKLNHFGDDLYQAERYYNPYRPRNAYFPKSLMTRILDELLSIKDEDELMVMLATEDLGLST